MENDKKGYYGMDVGKCSENIFQISVIMPVYNAGKYLYQTLDSLIYQTFREFELICVDDASSDIETKAILDAYQNKYEFMRVIYLNAHIGAGEARNIGFGEAKGEYVIFLDADDIFQEQMLEVMYNSILQENAEVCICGYENFSDADEMNKPSETVIRPKRYNKNCLSEDWMLYNSPNPWTKLCKRKFLAENHISFQSISACNDVYWSCMVQIKAEKICFLEDKILVRYRTGNPKQVTAQKSVLCIFYAMSAVLKKVDKERLGSEVMKAVILLFIWLVVGEIRISKKTKEIDQCHQLTRAILLDKINAICYRSEFYNGLLHSFMQTDFIDSRFPWNMTLYEQINLCKERLLILMNQTGKKVLWGNGKRGEAFQNFCSNQKISLFGITDSKNINIDKETAYGFKIISTDDAIYGADMVIASNSEIFLAVKESMKDIKIINLQEYCPFG